MGKTKITVVGDEPVGAGSSRPQKHKKKQSLRDERGVRVPGLKGGERVVAVGGELPPEEPRTTDDTDKSVGSTDKKSAKSVVARKPRQRGKKYLAARAKVDPQKIYSPEEAAKLVRETSISSFNGSIELHLVLNKGGLTANFKLPHSTGKEKKVEAAFEKKAPLAHLVVGKVDQPEAEIKDNLEAVLAAVGPKNIKKAVVSASMGPGIKISVG